MSLEWVLCAGSCCLLKLPSHHVLHAQLFLLSFWQLQDLEHWVGGVFFNPLHSLAMLKLNCAQVIAIFEKKN